MPIVSHPRLPKGDPSTHLYRFRVQTTFASVEKNPFRNPVYSTMYKYIIYIHTYISISLSLVVTKSIIFLPSNPFITNALSKDNCSINVTLKRTLQQQKQQNFLEAPHDSGSYALVNCLQSGKSHFFPSANH